MADKVKTYIIAEAGVNHNGSLDKALELIDVAADAGADAVKFQTFKSEKVISKTAPKAAYQKESTDAAETQLNMVKKLELDFPAHSKLVNRCREKGIRFMSTPFDLESLDFLVRDLDVEYLKISSGEITNAPLLLQAAQSGKPIILSTGMSALGDIETALGILALGYINSDATPSQKKFSEAYRSAEGQQALKSKVALLHCTTEYPAPFNDINLRAMDTLNQAFGLPVGISDHSLGTVIPIAAVARGAQYVEKHFTLDRNLPGPDHKASLEPRELMAMVDSIRQVEAALGSPVKVPAASEIKNMDIARKSIVAACTIKAGEVFTVENITVKRPGTGISPLYFWDLLGKTSSREYHEDEVIMLYEG